MTLIEIMIAVSIVAILAAVAMPKYGEMILKSQEGALKGNLGSMRSALSIYYGDTAGTYPTCAAAGPNSNILNSALVPNYIGGATNGGGIPTIKNGLHPPTNAVYCDSVLVGGSVHDGQGWYYDGLAPGDSFLGSVWVACDHTDTIGSIWTAY